MADDIEILKGKTFSLVVRWDSLPLIYKVIDAITAAAPAQITSVAHGIPDGWPVAVVSAGGMRQINAKNWPLRATDFHKATLVNPNVITLNDTNSTDYTGFTSGGSLVYYTPVSLAGFTARMQIRSVAEAADPPLVSLTTENGGIALDNTLKTITITISAAATAAFDWFSGVYDLELVSGAGVVTQILAGSVAAVDEVTR